MNLPEQIKQDPVKKESEVEQAQQTVKSWTDKIAFHEKELHFAKKNLRIHQTALKALIELENEMKKSG